MTTRIRPAAVRPAAAVRPSVDFIKSLLQYRNSLIIGCCTTMSLIQPSMNIHVSASQMMEA